MTEIDDMDDSYAEDEGLPMASADDGDGSGDTTRSLFNPKDQAELNDVRATRIALMKDLSNLKN